MATLFFLFISQSSFSCSKKITRFGFHTMRSENWPFLLLLPHSLDFFLRADSWRNHSFIRRKCPESHQQSLFTCKPVTCRQDREMQKRPNFLVLCVRSQAETNFFFLPYCTQTSGVMLNRSCHKENSSLYLDLKKETSATSPLSMTICFRSFVHDTCQIKKILPSPNFLRSSLHRWVLNFIKCFFSIFEMVV